MQFPLIFLSLILKKYQIKEIEITINQIEEITINQIEETTINQKLKITIRKIQHTISKLFLIHYYIFVLFHLF